MTIPFAVKVSQTLFVCILVPVYWRYYGSLHFLWFSDIALLASVVALWARSSLLASMQALAVVIVELIWIADFVASLALGESPTGLAAYMFDERHPQTIRALSLFHAWLPFLLLWMVYCLGYDRRAFRVQSAVGIAVLLLTYLVTDPERNINWVHGIDLYPFTLLPPWLYLPLQMISVVLLVYLPTHLALKRWMPSLENKRLSLLT